MTIVCGMWAQRAVTESAIELAIQHPQRDLPLHQKWQQSHLNNCFCRLQLPYVHNSHLSPYVQLTDIAKQETDKYKALKLVANAPRHPHLERLPDQLPQKLPHENPNQQPLKVAEQLMLKLQ